MGATSYRRLTILKSVHIFIDTSAPLVYKYIDQLRGTTMDAQAERGRKERGLIIAATTKLTPKGKVWVVPSQSGAGKYTVHLDPETPFCSCPDHEETGGKCKHIYAVEYTIRRERQADGT